MSAERGRWAGGGWGGRLVLRRLVAVCRGCALGSGAKKKQDRSFRFSTELPKPRAKGLGLGESRRKQGARCGVVLSCANGAGRQWCKGTWHKQINTQHKIRTRSKTNKQTNNRQQEASKPTRRNKAHVGHKPARAEHATCSSRTILRSSSKTDGTGSSSRVDLGPSQRALIFQACFWTAFGSVKAQCTPWTSCKQGNAFGTVKPNNLLGLG